MSSTDPTLTTGDKRPCPDEAETDRETKQARPDMLIWKPYPAYFYTSKEVSDCIYATLTDELLSSVREWGVHQPHIVPSDFSGPTHWRTPDATRQVLLAHRCLAFLVNVNLMPGTSKETISATKLIGILHRIITFTTGCMSGVDLFVGAGSIILAAVAQGILGAASIIELAQSPDLITHDKLRFPVSMALIQHAGCVSSRKLIGHHGRHTNCLLLRLSDHFKIALPDS